MNYNQLGIIILGLVCMGAALGFERSLLPRMAVEVWNIHSSTTVLYLVSTFGASKAFANVIAGPLADTYGRKPTLILGFVVGLPVMPYVIFAKAWSGITAMNVLFGISQGLLGSSLFFLLIDVMGPERRGIAVGIGECTIYVTTAVVNVLAGDLASTYGYRPVPFWVATMFALLGLLSTWPLQDTLDQVKAEQEQQLTKITSTLCLTEKNNDIKAVRAMLEEERTRLRGLASVSGRDTDDAVLAETKLFEGDDMGPNFGIVPNSYHANKVLEEETSFTSPSGVRELHKTLSERELQNTTAILDEQQGGHAPFLSTMMDEVYESVDDSSDTDCSSHHDSFGKLAEWDEAIQRNIKQIPSALKMVTKIPGSLVGCAPEGCGSETMYRTDNTESVNERTPLMDVPPSYDFYEVDSESDVEENGSEELDWDDVEENAKNLYPTAFHLLAHLLWNNPNFGILCLAGMSMNFKDGFAWGSFPLFFSQFHHLNHDHTDMLVAVYPLCWGFAQAFTGALSDIYGRHLFLLMGFGTCTIGTALFFVPGFLWGRPAEEESAQTQILLWIIADVFLGIGTAMANPALQAAVADEILPVYRGLGLGFYRFTRDMGYVVGALVCGRLTDVLGYPPTFLIVAGVLGSSWLIIYFFYRPLIMI